MCVRRKPTWRKEWILVPFHCANGVCLFTEWTKKITFPSENWIGRRCCLERKLGVDVLSFYCKQPIFECLLISSSDISGWDGLYVAWVYVYFQLVSISDNDNCRMIFNGSHRRTIYCIFRLSLSVIVYGLLHLCVCVSLCVWRFTGDWLK